MSKVEMYGSIANGKRLSSVNNNVDALLASLMSDEKGW